MSEIAPPIAALIEELAKLPGVGVKTAQRLAFFLLRSPQDQAKRLSEAIVRVKERMTHCSRCFNITEEDPCAICANPGRERQVICVVEEPLDVIALERTGVYKGLYHVLHGALSPMNGIGRRELRLDELLKRLSADPEIKEVILATNPGFEGDYTAGVIKKDIQERAALSHLRITALARGLSTSSDLEYADEETLSRALEGRREL